MYLNHTLVIQDEQILVTFNFLFAELKPMAYIQWLCKCSICLESLTKFPWDPHKLQFEKKQTTRDNCYTSLNLIQLRDLSDVYARYQITQLTLDLWTYHFHRKKLLSNLLSTCSSVLILLLPFFINRTIKLFSIFTD